jgi:hypothetical protein
LEYKSEHQCMSNLHIAEGQAGTASHPSLTSKMANWSANFCSVEGFRNSRDEEMILPSLG